MEMHDDLAQKIALLEFQIEGMKQRHGSSPELMPDLESLRAGVVTLAQDLHRICHRLHPAILENLGLVAALKFLCAESESLTGLRPKFVYGTVPDHIPADVSLCLYRVVQEALNNIVKHAETKRATVGLHGVRGGIRVVVTDGGCGFDPQSAASGTRLGLLFMAERVKLLGGRCTVRSAPGRGTRVAAFIPLFGRELS